MADDESGVDVAKITFVVTFDVVVGKLSNVKVVVH